jgi:ParB family transcriptional regulator, chromosome partitioning protein
MARKNLLANVVGPDVPDIAIPAKENGNSEMPERVERTSPPPTITKTGAFGSIGQSLERIASQAERAKEIEQQLTAGLVVVDLDPSLVDPAFIADRLGIDPEEDALLRGRIEKEGQLVPILVRPHPKDAKRYQVAYGHRRLRAVAALGRRVRAVVRELTDTELVVAQGQENSSRSDLSFLEKALFARTLEQNGYTRDVIMSALSVDKAALSRLISLAQKIPEDIAKAIGPAPNVGRVRWDELAEALQGKDALDRARTAVESFAFETAGSDQRFEVILGALKVKRASPTPPDTWHTPDGKPVARISQGPGKTTLVVNDKLEPDFGRFIAQRLASLYDDFKKEQRRGL